MSYTHNPLKPLLTTGIIGIALLAVFALSGNIVQADDDNDMLNVLKDIRSAVYPASHIPHDPQEPVYTGYRYLIDSFDAIEFEHVTILMHERSSGIMWFFDRGGLVERDSVTDNIINREQLDNEEYTVVIIDELGYKLSLDYSDSNSKDWLVNTPGKYTWYWENYPDVRGSFTVVDRF